ncbi:CBN-AOS-1 protein [Caenorhabditis brenneri]|uniref:CBN-AOS-1 protein n=1 Tax=Caenorhabditis brenneri TaxID=135651 RepID=G0N937_CAEBE|nr:CBN-AOS-1 protein [Caenorhabditis brenneri]
MTDQKENLEVSKQEQEVYDRQIRLWGMEAQNKLRNAKVLIIGGTQLGAEVAKTLSLAGVDALHLVDHRLVQESEVGSNFLLDASIDNTKLTKWVAARSFLTNLNRNVKLHIDETDLLSKSDSEIEAYVKDFTIVIVLDESYERTVKLNELCRKHKVRFVSGAIFGWVGYTFFDFNGHSFLTKAEESIETANLDEESQNTKTNKVVTLEEDQFEPKEYTYPSFVEAFNSDFSSKKVIKKCKRVVPTSYFLVKTMLLACKENKLSGDMVKDIEELIPIWKKEVVAGNHIVENQPVQPEKFNHLFAPEFTPTTACIGGIIGQESIKAISEGKLPIRNIFIYSALDSTGIACDFPLV